MRSFRGKFSFLLELSSSKKLLTISENFWEIWKKIIGRVVKSVFSFSAGRFIGLSLEKTSKEFATAAFNLSSEKSWIETSTFGKITTISFFWPLSIVFLWGFRNCLLRVLRNLLRSFFGSFLSLGSEIDWKFLKLLSKKLYHCSPVLKKDFNMLRGSFVENYSFCWSVCSSVFCDLGTNCIGSFGKKLSTGFSELISICLQEVFRNISFHEKPNTC